MTSVSQPCPSGSYGTTVPSAVWAEVEEVGWESVEGQWVWLSPKLLPTLVHLGVAAQDDPSHCEVGMPWGGGGRSLGFFW